VTFTLRLADRAHIMQQGVIVYDGDVATLDQERVASLLGVGRLLGRHVAAAADKRRAVAPKEASPNGAPKRKRAPAKPRTRAAAAPKSRAATKRPASTAKRGKTT